MSEDDGVLQHKLSDVVKLIDASPHNTNIIPEALQRNETSGEENCICKENIVYIC